MKKSESEIRHQYPSLYRPGPDQHWAINEAWSILDVIMPGEIPDDIRVWLAGAIAGKLVKERSRSEAEIGALREALRVNALRDGHSHGEVDEVLDAIAEKRDSSGGH